MATQVTQDQIVGTKLGYAQITSNFTTTSTTAVQVTGLTATVTVPAGGRSVKITAFCDYLYNSTINGKSVMSIWDGTVGSGTQLSQTVTQAYAANTGAPGMAVAVVTPAVGSKTYNVGLLTAFGGVTAGIEAGATFPAFILVELI